MIKLPFSPEKISAALSKSSKREKAALALTVLVLSALFIDRVMVATLYRKMGELDEQVSARESEIRKNMRIVAQKERIDARHVTYKPYLGAMSTENEEFTLFLKEVDTIARDNSVYVVDLKPTGTKEETGGRKYLINLNIEADIPSLVRFMYEIEDSRKLMTVEKYQVTPKSRDSQTAKCSLLISKLVMP